LKYKKNASHVAKLGYVLVINAMVYA